MTWNVPGAVDNLFTDLGSLSIDGGDGNDRIELGWLQSLDSLLAQLGAGDDNLKLLQVDSTSSTVDGGPGTDGLQGTLYLSVPVKRGFEFDTLIAHPRRLSAQTPEPSLPLRVTAR